MKTIRLEIDTSTIQGIEQGEKRKTRLENAGYTLIQTITGLYVHTLIYRSLP